MEADFRVDSIYVDEELGEMFAQCYDNVYGEEFEKFLGSPDTEEGRQNALTILEDSTYTMTDELRNEFISTFGLDDFGQEIIEVEEEDDFYDDSEDEVVESFSIREALNKIDLYNDNKYDLLNLYESCTLNENEKRELGKLLYDQADSSVIYDTLNKKYISEHYDDCPELYDELFGKLENMSLVINKTLNLSEDELDGEYIDETLDTLEDFVDEAKSIVDDIKEHKDLNEDLDKESLKSKLEKAAREFITNTLGYDNDFVDDYIFVDVKEDRFSDGSEAIKCEIRTELDYEECIDLSTHLNPILFAEDKYAYFDMEDAHTLVAYIRTDFSDDIVDEKTVNEFADLIKDISSMEELRKLYRDIRDSFEDLWTSATFSAVHDLVMDKADELNDNDRVNESKSTNEELYKDVSGVMGEPDETYTEDDLRGYWESAQDDPSISSYKGNFSAWFKDTISQMEEVEELDESKISDWDSTDSLGDDMDDKRIGYAVTVWENPNEYGKTVGVFDNIEEAKEVADKEYPNAYRVIIRKEEARGRFSYGWSTRENGMWKDKHINESKSIKEDLEDIEFIVDTYLPDLLVSDTDKPGKYEVCYRGNDSVSVIVEFDPSYSEYVFTIDGEGPHSYGSYEYIQGEIERALDKKLQKNESKSIKEGIHRIYVDGELKDEIESSNPVHEVDSIAYKYKKLNGVKEVRVEYADGTTYTMQGESKSIKESDEETPYTKEEIERDLKSITHNFTDKEGELKCGFEEEKNFGVEILKQHYKVVEASGDDRRDGTWYHISFAEPKNLKESWEKGTPVTLWWRDDSWSKTSPCYASCEYVGKTKDGKHKFVSDTYGWTYLLDAKNKKVITPKGKEFDVDNGSGWLDKHLDESNSIKEASNPYDLTDCPECGDKSFDTKKGKCTKCYYRESVKKKKSLSASIVEELMDDELETAEQKISSANTSINSSKLPAIFNRVKFVPGELNLDFGGGKFDNATEYLAQQGVESLVYDPYNRTAEHNQEVLARVRENGGADTITLSNVLNVIAEPEARLAVLRNCKRLLKSGGTLYITVYEGTGKGDERETKSGYQLNRKTDGYIDEISSVFSDVTPKGKLIIAK